MERTVSTAATARPPIVPVTDLLPPCHGLAHAKSAGPIPGRSRTYFGNRYVYSVISQRARGLSVGVNLNPDRFCNFDCSYCEVNRSEINHDVPLDLHQLQGELRKMLTQVQQGLLRDLSGYHGVPEELLQLKEVALSGDGEPTLCPSFTEVVQTVVHLRAQRAYPFFKVVLITNATGLHLPHVQNGIKLLTAQDEVWAKLDAGTQSWMERVNVPKMIPLKGPVGSLELVMNNILTLGQRRSIVIQSLFPLLNGEEPPIEEIEQYVQRLLELKEAGAQISMVQVYSAHRPAMHPQIGHLPLKCLSRIAQRVREVTGLRAEVF